MKKEVKTFKKFVINNLFNCNLCVNQYYDIQVLNYIITRINSDTNGNTNIKSKATKPKSDLKQPYADHEQTIYLKFPMVILHLILTNKPCILNNNICIFTSNITSFFQAGFFLVSEDRYQKWQFNDPSVLTHQSRCSQ